MVATTEIKIRTEKYKDPMLQLYSRLHARIQKLIAKGYRWEGCGNWIRVYGKNKQVMITDRVTGGYNEDPFIYNVTISFYRKANQ